MYTNMAIKITKIAYWAFPKFYTVHSKIALILSSSVYTSLNITTHSKFTLSGRSPAFLTCDYFISLMKSEISLSKIAKNYFVETTIVLIPHCPK